MARLRSKIIDLLRSVSLEIVIEAQNQTCLRGIRIGLLRIGNEIAIAQVNTRLGGQVVVQVKREPVLVCIPSSHARVVGTPKVITCSCPKLGGKLVSVIKVHTELSQLVPSACESSIDKGWLGIFVVA